MKKAHILIIIAACAGGVAALVCSPGVREKLFSGKYEDKYLKVVETARLIGDFLTWPYNFVRALLP